MEELSPGPLERLAQRENRRLGEKTCEVPGATSFQSTRVIAVSVTQIRSRSLH